MCDNYNVNCLMIMAQTWLNAENEFNVFLLTFNGGLVHNMDPERYGDFVEHKTESLATWRALSDACTLVGADIEKVVGMAKAMNRYEKRENYTKCAFVGWRAEDSARRYLSE